MAGGLLGFLGFGKKSKPNLTPDVTTMNAQSTPFYGQLKDFAEGRISGQTTGFGQGFLDKTTNPAIAQIDANFQNRTMPTISSEASKRGMARSTIVQDQIGQADAQRNRDINSTVAEFYKLNEMQKKTDQSEGVRVGQDLDANVLNQSNLQAAESRDLRDKTLGVANKDNEVSRANQQRTIAMLAGAATGGMSGGFSGALTGGLTGASEAGASSGALAKVLSTMDTNTVQGLTPDQVKKLLDLI